MAVLRLRYVETWTDDCGHARHYFRKDKKSKRIPLPGLPGSAEFMAAYAVAANKSGAVGVIGGGGRTFGALIDKFKNTPDFKRLKPSYRVEVDRDLENFREAYGIGPVVGLTREHVDKMMADRAKTPAAANVFLKRLRVLIKYSFALGWRTTDPTFGVKKYKEGEHHTWTEEQLEQYEDRWPLGTRQRTAYGLALFTGQRRQDVCQMSWAAISKDGSGVYVVQEKTGAKLLIPLHKGLMATLEAWPKTQGTIIKSDLGQAYLAPSFGKFMASSIEEAGLPEECVLHGLRKAAARRLAEANCTPHQIMSITGHKTLEEVERYTRAAAQMKLAKQAVKKLKG